MVTCPWCSYSLLRQQRGRKTTMPGHPSCQSRGLSKITKSQATQTSCLARAQHKLSRITTREGCLDSLSLCKKQLSPAVSTLKKQTPNIGSSKSRWEPCHSWETHRGLPLPNTTQRRAVRPPTCQGQPPRSRREAMPGTLWDTGHVLQLERRFSSNTIRGCRI